MANLYRIPEGYVEGFDLLAQLSDDKRQILLESIRDTEVGILLDELAKTKSERIGLTDRQLSDILMSLNGIIFLKEHNTDPVEEFTASIVDAYMSETTVTNFDRKKIEEFIVQFLTSAKNYRLTIKAKQLAYERDKVATRFRVLTDLRPIFDDEDAAKIQGSIIIHNLRIDYRENTRSRKITFALDEGDIIDLKKSLQRALDKQSAIKESLTTSVLKSIDVR